MWLSIFSQSYGFKNKSGFLKTLRFVLIMIFFFHGVKSFDIRVICVLRSHLVGHVNFFKDCFSELSLSLLFPKCFSFLPVSFLLFGFSYVVTSVIQVLLLVSLYVIWLTFWRRWILSRQFSRAEGSSERSLELKSPVQNPTPPVLWLDQASLFSCEKWK